MDNIKKFEDFLDRMQGLLDNAKKQGHIIVRVEDLESTFPELRESEDEKIRKGIIDFLWKEKIFLQEAHSSVENNPKYRFVMDAIAWLEKQGEHTDKVEPKFQNWQWIVWQNKCYKVNDNGCGYELIDQNGLSTSLEYGTVDASARLWNITKDAKDGDVLFHSDSASNGIFIFKEIIDKGFGNEVICYCDYDSEDHFCLGEHHACCWTDAKILHPATKEQRDLLFQKMKEAGWEWSEETHELKEIKQKSARSEEDMKEALRTEYEKGRADTIAEMKSSWNEEDENTIKVLMNIIRKSEVIDSIIYTDSLKEKLYDWLNSLRPQKQWKPSNEQIEALEHFVRSIGESDYASPYENNTKLLYLLLNDLKKLTE